MGLPQDTLQQGASQVFNFDPRPASKEFGPARTGKKWLHRATFKWGWFVLAICGKSPQAWFLLLGQPQSRPLTYELMAIAEGLSPHHFPTATRPSTWRNSRILLVWMDLERMCDLFNVPFLGKEHVKHTAQQTSTSCECLQK